MNEHDAVEGEERAVRDLLGGAGRRAAVPPEDLAAMRAAARDAWRELVAARASRRRREGTVLALAASLLLALVAGWWWTSRTPAAAPAVVARVERLAGAVRISAGPRGAGTLGPAQELAAGVELETDAGAGGPAARLALRLVAGPSVRVDAGSSLRLASSRRLELSRGAVYVDSGAAPAPAGVEVITPFGTVRDVGTQFEVRLEERAGGLRLRVREGLVTLAAAGAAHRAAGGEELALAGDGALTRRAVAPFGPAWDWVVAAAPALAIEGRSLAEFLDWVCRETGWRLAFADEALASSASAIRLHGTIEGLTPAEALAAVLPGSGLEHRIEDGALVVARPAGVRTPS